MAFQDILMFAMLLFAIGLVIVFTGVVAYQFRSIPYLNQSFNYTVNATVHTNYPVGWFSNIARGLDWFFVLMAFALAITLFISSYFIQAHPIFAFVGFLGGVVWILIAPWISNSWVAFASSSVVATVIGDYSMVNNFFIYLPMIGFVVGVIGSILLYGKNPRVNYG